MSTLNYPDRIFSLSDCHGGQETFHPLRSPDIVARLSEAIRSDIPGVQHFDTFGAPDAYYRFIVQEAARLQKENPSSGPTGLFINNAARTEVNSNGQPFYRADIGNLRIVITPLDIISGVRDSVKRLQELPNKDNGLYKNNEQHRSSIAPRIIADNHGIPLTKVKPSIIPELPDGRTLGYVDRFGNLVLSEKGTTRVDYRGSVGTSIRPRISGLVGQNVWVQIGTKGRYVTIGTSLADAKPGSLVIYENDDSVEILSKWDESWTPAQRLENSAFKQFGEPAIGTSFSFDERPNPIYIGGLG